MKSLVLLASLFVAGCSVGVSHQTEDEHSTEKSSDMERSRTTVAVSILDETTPRHDPKVPNASRKRSTTIVEVIVREQSPKVVNSLPPPPVTRSADRMIQVAGNRNTVILGNVYVHRHEHVHVHQAPKPAPVRINVRAEDRVSGRLRRRRMVETRIARIFPHYRD
jgi:hypothetical protein